MSRAKRKPQKRKPPFTVERKAYAQLRYFEVLHIIKDPSTGEVLFTGDKIMAEKMLKLLNQDRKAGITRRRKGRK